MRWLEQGSGGVLEVRTHLASAGLALHVVLLAGQTWAYWETSAGGWLGLVNVGQA